MHQIYSFETSFWVIPLDWYESLKYNVIGGYYYCPLAGHIAFVSFISGELDSSQKKQRNPFSQMRSQS